MLGYMNKAAFEKTQETNLVTFYSRGRKELWTKGETSGNYLEFISMKADCDKDTLLIRAKAKGPSCHLGTENCFDQKEFNFIQDLEKVISDRFDDEKNENSYVQKMKQKGLDKIAQKVGEEAVELVIEAKNDKDEDFKNEAADLFFHYILLLKMKNFTFKDILTVLETRHRTA